MKFIILQLGRSEIYNGFTWKLASISLSAGLLLLGPLGEKLLPCFWQLLEASCTPWHMASSSIFKHLPTSFWLTFLPPFFSYRDPWDHILGPPAQFRTISHFKGPPSIITAEFFMTRWGIRSWTSLEVIILLVLEFSWAVTGLIFWPFCTQLALMYLP